MSIGVSVRTTKFAARNNGIGTSRHCPSFERSGNSLSRSVYREGVVGFAFVTPFGSGWKQSEYEKSTVNPTQCASYWPASVK